MRSMQSKLLVRVISVGCNTFHAQPAQPGLNWCASSGASRLAFQMGQRRFHNYTKMTGEELKTEFEQIGAEIKIAKLEDWYKVKVLKVHRLRYICGSQGVPLATLLERAYPDHDWKPWLFVAKQHGLWEDLRVQRRYFDWALQLFASESENRKPSGKKLDLAHWYSITARKVIENHGRTLILDKYDGSLFKALSTIYPEHTFIEWRFRSVPSTFWQNEANRRKFFEHLMTKELKLDPKVTENWYNITGALADQFGGNGFICHFYHSSTATAIMELFPNHQWQPWRFQKCPNSFWDLPANQKRFLLEWALPRVLRSRSPVVSFSSQSLLPPQKDLMELIYSVPNSQLIKEGGSALLRRYDGSIPKMCVALFPEHHWDFEKFTKTDSWTPRNAKRHYTNQRHPQEVEKPQQSQK